MSDYLTLWDGTRELGPYLAVDYDVPIPAQSQQRLGHTRALVVRRLLEGPQTIHALVVELGRGGGDIGGAIGALRRAGSVDVVGRDRHAGREVWVYGLTETGRTREARA